MEHVVRIQHCRVWRFVNWGWAEQAGEKLGGQGAPVPTVLLPRFSVWVVRTTSTPAVRKIVPKFMVGGGLRLKRGRRKGERDLVLRVKSGHTQSKEERSSLLVSV